jgi:F-type H+-transporting ATPase subunit O
MLLSRTLRQAARPLASRGLCASAEAAPQVMFGTAGRYANALYAAAAKTKVLSEVEADLLLLKQTLSTSSELAAFCSDPSLGRETKAKAIVDVLSAAKATDITKNAMAILAENGRLGDVSKVIDMYGELMNASKGEVSAVITSAETLPPAELAQITKQLDSFLVRAVAPRRHPLLPLVCVALHAPLSAAAVARAQEPGQKKISLSTKVDPALVSGITVEIGDKYLDFSVATQLKKLQTLLKDGI